MLSATDLRTELVNSATVETEINLINLNILANTSNVSCIVDRETVTTVVGNSIIGTTMTLNSDYYLAWQSRITDDVKVAEMNKIIDYYRKLGYTVYRKSNDGQYLYWQISW